MSKNNNRLAPIAKRGGFTLIEIMVAVSIFALVMVIAVGAILSVVAADKKAQALNSVITNLNFAIEGMTRDLRTGYNYDCYSDASDGLTDWNSSQGPCHTLTLTSSQSANQDVTYSLSNTDHAIYKQVGTDPAYPLTAPEVTINRLDFYATGTSNSSTSGGQDTRQPKILIVIQGTYSGYGQISSFSLQTLVSQRKLDI